MFKKLLTRDNAFAKIKAKNREEMFQIFSERAFKLGLVTSKDDFFNSLQKREDQGSTEIAPGIAIPHTKDISVKRPFIMVATSKKGVKFHGFSKVNLIFLLAAPKDDPTYMTLMAKSARLLKKEEFVNKITNSDVAEDILQTIFSFDERMSVSLDTGKENMHLIALLLNDSEKKALIFPLFIELGIKNATMIESTYMIEKFQNEMPIFSVFSLGTKKTYNSVMITGLSDDPQVAGKLSSLMKTEGIDIWEPGAGSISMVKLNSVFGGIDSEIDF